MTRGRPPATTPSIPLNVALPIDIKARMDVHLFSDIEQRVPKGSYSFFLTALLRQFFSEMDKANEPPKS